MVLSLGHTSLGLYHLFSGQLMYGPHSFRVVQLIRFLMIHLIHPRIWCLVQQSAIIFILHRVAYQLAMAAVLVCLIHKSLSVYGGQVAAPQPGRARPPEPVLAEKKVGSGVFSTSNGYGPVPLICALDLQLEAGSSGLRPKR